MPLPYTDKLRAGDDLDFIVPVTLPDGSAANLSGGKARWWLAPSVLSPDSAILLKKDTDAATCTLTLIAGFWTVTVSISHAESKSIDPKNYYHEIEVEDASGKVNTAFTGNLIILPTLIASKV